MRLIYLVLLTGLLAACGSDETDNQAASANHIATSQASSPAKCQISTNSIGDIALGDTMAQVRLNHPHAVITPLQDEEKVAFTSIKITPEIEIFAYTENTDITNTTRSETSPISYLSTSSRVCKTAEGVYPSMLVADAEQIYGAVQQIIMSDADAQQIAEFDQQPAELSFQIDDSGAFDLTDKQLPKITTDYQDGAKIQSISVMSLPDEEAASTVQ